ncbi:TetR/AcrR family transcriptional regulator [Actinoplanes sp. NPDC051861]|uniref:TetR/AcrR family transcriptional regulator n=1 Tax=Actinoplanes sp. NPDC051861 TaxID=3155170 RepID=UPI00344AFD03
MSSARQTELLEAAYRYALANGLADVSLRPLAAAIGSSPRVLIYLFGSKEGLVRALLARAREDELRFLRDGGGPLGLMSAAERVWAWLAAEEHRPLLRLWVEAYARSLVEPGGAWAGFAETTVRDWLGFLAAAEPDGPDRSVRHTLVLAVLRGGLLDLLATGEEQRVTAAVRHQLDLLIDTR